MRHSLRQRIVAAAFWLTLGAALPGWAQEASEGIGVATVVQGAVSVERQGLPSPASLAVRQPLLPGDVISTTAQSRAKALFQDDTLLVVGPRTTAAIADYLYDPDQRVRRMTVQATGGTVRALVGRAFEGLGSLFTIQAGLASIMTHAAYCLVWTGEQETGVANIGKSGTVSFASGGRVVMLEPGQMSVARTGKPPGPPELMKKDAASGAGRALAETEVPDDAEASQMAEQEVEEELPSCPPGSPPGGICPRKPPPPAQSPATPPAVTSGAVRR